MVDKSVQNHAKGQINRELDRGANANVERLTNVLAESTSGQKTNPTVQGYQEQNAKNAAKTIEIMANIHETGQHPAPDKPSGGGQTSNDGGSGGNYMP